MSVLSKRISLTITKRFQLVSNYIYAQKIGENVIEI